MTERRTMEQFETWLGGRVRAYTDPATERRIDAFAISRKAMSSRPTGWPPRRLDLGLPGGRSVGVRWVAAVVAVVLLGTVSAGVVGRLSISSTPTPAPSAVGSVPDALLHSWARPSAVVPGLDQWGTGFLRVASDFMEFGPEPGPAASKSSITVAGLDTLVAMATTETQGCVVGNRGAYRWSLEGKDTVMTLTPVSADACPARETALAGQWVRSDFPPPGNGEVTLPRGTHLTSSFDPFGNPAVPMRLSYTVPEGWTLGLDQPATFLLHHLDNAFASPPPSGSFIAFATQPRMAADFAEGATCDPFSEAPGVGHTVDEIAAVIRARSGVVSTSPTALTIGGFAGQMLDLRLAPSWTGGCRAPEGHVVGIPILLQAGGTGPSFGIATDKPLRLILLDLTGGRTMSVAFYIVGPSPASSFDAQAAAAMPIILSLEFHAPTP